MNPITLQYSIRDGQSFHLKLKPVLMKKYIFLTLILLSSFKFVNAQSCDFSQKSSIVTNSSCNIPTALQTANYNLVARDQVTLSAGFSLSNTSGNEFTVKTDHTIAPPAEYLGSEIDGSTRALDKTNFVPGTIGGSINVGESGSASYTVPIQVSPGSNGMQPNIAISYNSGGGNGLMGYGWDLGATSAISFVYKNKYYNGDYSYLENYEMVPSLDGERLIQNDDLSYSPENNPYTKVVFNGTQYIVTSQDGIVTTYGSGNGNSTFYSIGGSNAYCYSIDRITDTNGNYIQYYYTGDNTTGEYRVSEIQYTGNASKAPYNSVKFYYSQRNDENKSYINGQAIRGFSNGSLYSTYSFNYIYDGVLTKLNKISYSSLGIAYNPTIINWGNTPNYTNITSSDYTIPLSRPDKNNYQQIVGDINMDGLQEIVQIATNEAGESHLEIAFPQPDGTYSYKQANIKPKWEYYQGNVSIQWDPQSLQVMDWDGDGQTDILIQYASYYIVTSAGIFWDGNTAETIRQEVFKYNWIESTSSLYEQYLPIYDEKIEFDVTLNKFDAYYLIYGDYDLNGNMDIVAVGQNKIKAIYLNGSQISTIPAQSADFVSPLDIDGDGRAELLLRNIGKDSYILKFSDITKDFQLLSTINFGGSADKLSFGDINGDGKTDYMKSDELIAYYGTGSGFVKGPTLSIGTGWPGNHASSLLFIDINGDGKDDVIYARDNMYRIFLSKGTSFTSSIAQVTPTLIASIKNTVLPPDISTNSVNYSILPRNFKGLTVSYIPRPIYDTRYIQNICMFAAPDANGKLNIVYIDDINNQFFTAHLNDDLEANLKVNSIYDGNNSLTQITFSTYIDDQSRDNENVNIFPIKVILGPLTCVSNVKQTTQDGYKLSDISYKYDECVVHTAGRGFLGFAYTKKTDNLTKFYTENYYKFYGENEASTTGVETYSPTLVTSFVESDESFESSQNYSLPTVYGTEDQISKRLFASVVKYSATENFRLGVSSKGFKSFDATLGRVTSNLTTTSDGWSIRTSSAYETVTGNTSRLKSVTTTKSRNNENYTSTTNYFYENSSYPFRCTKQIKDDLFITEFNSFDIYGNVTQTTVSVSGGLSTKPQVTSQTFDTYGRFVISSTDVAGYTSYASYREPDGVLLSKTDINGLVTRYSYSTGDNIASSSTSMPDGNVGTKTMAWDNSGSGLYYTQKSVSNGNTVTEYYNTVGQKVKETKYGINNTLLTTTWNYNKDNLTLTSVNLPGVSTPDEFTYDEIKRIKKETGLNKSINYSYSGSKVTITDNSFSTAVVKTTTVDALGNITKVEGTNGTIDYSYFVSGKVKSITTGGAKTEFTYDPVTLDQLSITDPNAGKISYTYNGFGQVLSQTDAKNQTTTNVYDDYGRPISMTQPNGLKLQYTYSTTPGQLGLVTSYTQDVATANDKKITESYTYDNLCRTTSITTKTPITPGGTPVSFTTTCAYNGINQLSSITYPTGLTVNNGYDSRGNLTTLNNAAGGILWQGNTVDALSRWTQFTLGNGLITKHVYSATDNQLQQILTGTSAAQSSIQNLGFTFNTSGQLTQRTDGALTEKFTYDAMDRLLTSQVGTGTIFSTQYDNNGNITSTTLNGIYTYGNTAHPHAVTSIAGTTATSTGTSPSINTTANYNADNKVLNMYYNDNSCRVDFTYGIDGNRVRLDNKTNGVLQNSKVYIGNCEFVVNSSGVITAQRTMVYAPTGICAVYEKDSSNNVATHYIHTDYQGSWLAITDASKNVENRYSYDAWGRPRDPLTWQLKTINYASQAAMLADLIAMQPRFDRGYTGHEMMANFGLINMNGRIYDPYLQRFLSPDPYVQAPENGQSFNRYAYCLNNPLRYIDPSGYKWGIFKKSWWKKNWKKVAIVAIAVGVSIVTAGLAAPSLGALVASSLAGCAGGFVSGSLNAWADHKSFGEIIGAGIMGGIIGGITGLATAGLGSLLGNTPTSLLSSTGGNTTRTLAQALGINAVSKGAQVAVAAVTGSVGSAVGGVIGNSLTSLFPNSTSSVPSVLADASGAGGGNVSGANIAISNDPNYMKNLVIRAFGNQPGLEHVYFQGETYNTQEESYWVKSNGKYTGDALGFMAPNGHDMYISPAAQRSPQRLFTTIYHELVHLQQINKGLKMPESRHDRLVTICEVPAYTNAAKFAESMGWDDIAIEETNTRKALFGSSVIEPDPAYDVVP
jgi:RHS repeat-associated protein